jgi:metal-dependent hydrolase (beta-lactamase superfamily II)
VWQSWLGWAAQAYPPLLAAVCLSPMESAVDCTPSGKQRLSTPETTILFDLGLHERREHSSPLLRNMAALGVNVADIDLLIISHPHGDHMGGMAHQMRRTFAPSGQPVDLHGMLAFVPATLSHATAHVTIVDGPQILASGIAIMGPIASQDFFLGWTPEQSLAINVEGEASCLSSGVVIRPSDNIQRLG